MRLFALTMALAALLGLAVPGAVTAAGRRCQGRAGDRHHPVPLDPESQHRFDGRQELCPRHDAAAVHCLRPRLGARLLPLHRPADLRERPRRARAAAGRRRGPRRTRGGRPHLHHPAGCHLGRRHAGDHRRRAVHLRGRQASRQRHQQCRALPAHPRHRRRRRADLRRPCRPDHVRLQRARRFPRPAGASRARGLRGGSRDLPQPHHVRYRPDQSRPVVRPLSRERGVERLAHRARGQPDLVGQRAALQADRRQGDREHGGARGQPALGRDRHDRRRARPDPRPGAGVRAAQQRRVPRPLPAGAALRARRRQSRQSDPGRPAGAQGADARARPPGDERAAVPGPPAGRRHQGQRDGLGLQR